MTPRSVDTTHSSRFRPATRTRIAAGGVAAGAVLALVSGVGAAATASAEAPQPHKSYVCKYVSKPGEAERLQTGQNPIWVDNHSLVGSPDETFVGQEFKDGQFRSVVIVANTPKLDPEPTIEDCPPVTPPTTTTTTPPTTTTTTKTTTPPPTTTTTTPPATTTTTPPATTTTTPPATTTTPPATTTTTPAAVPSTYPLQPVQGGAAREASASVGVAPLQALLALVVLLGLWVALGAPLPRVTRSGSSGGDH